MHCSDMDEFPVITTSLFMNEISMTYNRNLGLTIYHIVHAKGEIWHFIFPLSLITKLGKVLVTMLPKLVKGK
jgi:hypothetical protein